MAENKPEPGGPTEFLDPDWIRGEITKAMADLNEASGARKPQSDLVKLAMVCSALINHLIGEYGRAIQRIKADGVTAHQREEIIEELTMRVAPKARM